MDEGEPGAAWARERARIASDLHDVVLQRLGVAQIQADNIASAIGLGKLPQAQTLAEDLKKELAEAITEVRLVIAGGLRDRSEGEDLPGTLERHARSFEEKTDIRVELHIDCGRPSDIPLPVALLLSQAAEEAFANVAAHAGATRVEVSLRQADDALELRIRDDGEGPVSDDDEERPHLGLRLIQEKAGLAGGAARLVARPEGGAEIIVRLPAGAGG
jgi:two-component system NarL family sensor kinase